MTTDNTQVGLNKLCEAFIDGDISAGQFKRAVQSIIRTEKLKLLDRLSSHQEDLFWWTGGEYEKTKAVDMRAIAAEREQLEAEL